MFMILRSCFHIENKLCALNALKYVILIPQFTNHELGNSNDVTSQKWYVVIGELSLIMNSPYIYIWIHPYLVKVCTNPILLLSL